MVSRLPSRTLNVSRTAPFSTGVSVVSMERSWIPFLASRLRVSVCAAATRCGSSGAFSCSPALSRTVPAETLCSPTKAICATNGRSVTSRTSAPRPCWAPRTKTCTDSKLPVAMSAADGVLHQLRVHHAAGAHARRAAHGLRRHALGAAHLHGVHDEPRGGGLRGRGVLREGGAGKDAAEGEREEGRREGGPSPMRVKHAGDQTVWVFDGTRNASDWRSSATVTSISSPGLNSELRIFSESGSSR